MKKFKFSLEKVLQLKEQLLKNLKNELGALQYQLTLKEKEIEDLKEKYSDSELSYKIKMKSQVQAYEIQYYKDYLNQILNNIKIKEEEKLLILKKIQAKQDEIIEATKEISSIEKLKEKRLADYNYQAQKQQDILIEEFVSNFKSQF